MDASADRAARAPALLELSGISKRFGAVRALEDVQFDVHPSEVVALVGDNGAGKSTLIKVISGIHKPDDGTIRWQGREVSMSSPNDAAKLGIATGRNLAEACRDSFSRRTSIGLWIQAEIVAAACDVAEVVGAAAASRNGVYPRTGRDFGCEVDRAAALETADQP